MNSVTISIFRSSGFAIPGTRAGSMNGPQCFIITRGIRLRSVCFGCRCGVDAGELTGRAPIVAGNPRGRAGRRGSRWPKPPILVSNRQSRRPAATALEKHGEDSLGWSLGADRHQPAGFDSGPSFDTLTNYRTYPITWLVPTAVVASLIGIFLFLRQRPQGPCLLLRISYVHAGGRCSCFVSTAVAFEQWSLPRYHDSRCAFRTPHASRRAGRVDAGHVPGSFVFCDCRSLVWRESFRGQFWLWTLILVVLRLASSILSPQSWLIRAGKTGR